MGVLTHIPGGKAAFAFTVTVCLLLDPSPSAAASCSSLKAELSSLRKVQAAPGNSPLQSAHAQQAAAIAAAERDARYFRCDAMAHTPKCTGLKNKISRMKENLRTIDRRLKRTQKLPAKTANRIKQIEQKLNSSTCRAGEKTAQQASKDKRFLSKLFDSDRAKPENEAPTGYRTLPSGLVITTSHSNLMPARTRDDDLQALHSRAGLAGERLYRQRTIPKSPTYRTLCVRTCDGYFFPVSFATTKKQFSDDAARCGEMCPAASTELYVYPNPGGQQSDMVSLSGQAYTDMANAYKFKTRLVKACSCRTSESEPDRLRMTALTGSPAASIGDDGRIRLSLHPDAPPPFFRQSKTEDARLDWQREPIPASDLPGGLDPVTAMDLKGGFNANATIPVRTGAADESERPARKKLPVLGRKSVTSPEAPPEEAVSPPVFAKHGDDGFRPSVPQTPIRVVGPEYFVAQ